MCQFLYLYVCMAIKCLSVFIFLEGGKCLSLQYCVVLVMHPPNNPRGGVYYSHHIFTRLCQPIRVYRLEYIVIKQGYTCVY